MPFIFSSDVKLFTLPNVIFAALASPSTGSVENACWKFKLAAKSSGQTHQLTREEIIVVITGSAFVQIGKEGNVITAGDAIIVPAYTDFAISNESNEDFEGIAVLPVGGQAMMIDQQIFTPPWAL